MYKNKEKVKAFRDKVSEEFAYASQKYHQGLQLWDYDGKMAVVVTADNNQHVFLVFESDSPSGVSCLSIKVFGEHVSMVTLTPSQEKISVTPLDNEEYEGELLVERFLDLYLNGQDPCYLNFHIMNEKMVKVSLFTDDSSIPLAYIDAQDESEHALDKLVEEGFMHKVLYQVKLSGYKGHYVRLKCELQGGKVPGEPPFVKWVAYGENSEVLTEPYWMTIEDIMVRLKLDKKDMYTLPLFVGYLREKPAFLVKAEATRATGLIIRDNQYSLIPDTSVRGYYLPLTGKDGKLLGKYKVVEGVVHYKGLGESADFATTCVNYWWNTTFALKAIGAPESSGVIKQDKAEDIKRKLECYRVMCAIFGEEFIKNLSGPDAD